MVVKIISVFNLLSMNGQSYDFILFCNKNIYLFDITLSKVLFVALFTFVEITNGAYGRS
jgi:hypothetical protein